jgi:hypothetical protein
MQMRCVPCGLALALSLSCAEAALASAQRRVDVATLAAHTGAVVDARVTKSEFKHSEAEGPWTVVHLDDVRTLFGPKQPAEIALRIQGGFLPNGYLIIADDQPVFANGKRYILFLRNGEWHDWPLIPNTILRVDRIGGREVLVDQQERPLVSLAAEGMRFARAPLFDDERDMLFHVQQGKAPAVRKSFDAKVLPECLSRSDLQTALRQLFQKHKLSLRGGVQYERAPAIATAAARARQKSVARDRSARSEERR